MRNSHHVKIADNLFYNPVGQTVLFPQLIVNPYTHHNHIVVGLELPNLESNQNVHQQYHHRLLFFYLKYLLL
ncbi:Uncharacterised protein [Providencia rettgeri]|uniref:Uncharacterized protein n=1 Tax=Providencia rettgeri TaxID=587 RepID=A0A9N8H1V9_PRORE|nr:Uncharacterised protein [Providencia rettgeri]